MGLQLVVAARLVAARLVAARLYRFRLVGHFAVPREAIVGLPGGGRDKGVGLRPATRELAGKEPLMTTQIHPWLALSALLVGCALAAETTPAPAADPGQTVQVFILAGQSNMEGQGVVSLDHPQYYNGGKGNLVWSMEHSASRDKMRHLRDANGHWAIRDDVEISFNVDGVVRKGPLTVGYTGYGGSSHIGPELQFGHMMGDFFAEPVLLIKTAWGGKSLYQDFRPPSSGGEVGPYYKQMIQEVRDALTALGDRPYEIRGFVWMQGWNDMCTAAAVPEYADNLVHLAADLRREFNSPRLPIVIGELGNGGPAEPNSGMQKFRDAQRQGAARIENALFVPTQDFARPPELSPNVGHGHHWYGNAESYFLVGAALGEGMQRLLLPRDPP